MSRKDVCSLVLQYRGCFPIPFFLIPCINKLYDCLNYLLLSAFSSWFWQIICQHGWDVCWAYPTGMAVKTKYYKKLHEKLQNYNDTVNSYYQVVMGPVNFSTTAISSEKMSQYLSVKPWDMPILRGVSKSFRNHPNVKAPDISFLHFIHRTSLKSHYAKLHLLSDFFIDCPQPEIIW